MTMTKVLRKQLSGDERLQRYFHRLRADFERQRALAERYSIVLERPDGVREVLQITNILTSPDWTTILVR